MSLFGSYAGVAHYVVALATQLLALALVVIFASLAWVYGYDAFTVLALAACGLLAFLLLLFGRMMLDDLSRTSGGVGVAPNHHKGCACPACRRTACANCSYCRCAVCLPPVQEPDTSNA